VNHSNWSTVCKTVRPMLSVGSLSVTWCIWGGQTVGCIKMKLGMEHGGRSQPRPRVRWGPSSPTPKRGQSPNFWPICGQTCSSVDQDAAPLGMEVGLDRSDIVLDGHPPPLPKTGAEPTIFAPYLLWPNGWMNQDATWYGVGLVPGHIVLDRNPAPPK